MISQIAATVIKTTGRHTQLFMMTADWETGKTAGDIYMTSPPPQVPPAGDFYEMIKTQIIWSPSIVSAFSQQDRTLLEVRTAYCKMTAGWRVFVPHS